jgi:uncharacterized membrane protein YidH (DUF202 family)
MAVPGQTGSRQGDPGLQPERTDLAWSRTTLALIAAAAVFLGWMPGHGGFVGVLVAAAILTALGINLTLRRRYRRAKLGLSQGRMPPDLISTLAVAASVVVLAALGIYAVLLLPLPP